MIFHRARIKLPDTDYPIIMNNSPLSNIKNHKYLGVILDSKMSWIQHISYVKNKVAKGIGIMFKARTYLDRRSLINLSIFRVEHAREVHTLPPMLHRQVSRHRS